MRKLIKRVLNSTKEYSVWDFGILKVSLVSLGILLGAYFSDFFLSKIVFVWILYLVTFALILYKTFIKY
jgi:small multidrug resistance family-3 protein